MVDYQRFLGSGASAEEAGDAKAFAARHAAARGALSHLEQILKLAEEGGDEAQVNEVLESLAHCREQMAQLKEEADSDDDADGGG